VLPCMKRSVRTLPILVTVETEFGFDGRRYIVFACLFGADLVGMYSRSKPGHDLE
jgi:hypothetical protein